MTSFRARSSVGQLSPGTDRMADRQQTLVSINLANAIHPTEPLPVAFPTSPASVHIVNITKTSQNSTNPKQEVTDLGVTCTSC